jgi:DNA-binding transcriptional LysR family regulator
MELRQLRVFAAVVEHHTVTAAALALGMAPSSISEQIRVLEASLGTALFDRGPKGMRPTAAGERLRPWAATLLEGAERARREVSGTQPELRLGALETIVATHVPAILGRLTERRPGLRVEVRPETARDRLLALVASGDLEAALLLDFGASLGDLGFAAPDAPLRFCDVETVPLSLISAPDHRLAGADRVTQADLRGEKVLTNSPACTFWLAGRRLLGSEVERVQVGGVHVIKAWIEQGMGISLVPDFAVTEELASGRLARLAFDTGDLRLRLVWHPGHEAVPGLKELLYAASVGTGLPATQVK